MILIFEQFCNFLQLLFGFSLLGKLGYTVVLEGVRFRVQLMFSQGSIGT